MRSPPVRLGCPAGGKGTARAVSLPKSPQSARRIEVMVAPHEALEHTLNTADGLDISAVHLVGAATGLCFVVVHGFTGNWREERVQKVVRRARRLRLRGRHRHAWPRPIRRSDHAGRLRGARRRGRGRLGARPGLRHRRLGGLLLGRRGRAARGRPGCNGRAAGRCDRRPGRRCRRGQRAGLLVLQGHEGHPIRPSPGRDPMGPRGHEARWHPHHRPRLGRALPGGTVRGGSPARTCRS